MSGEGNFYQTPVEVLREYSGECYGEFYQTSVEVLRHNPYIRSYQSVIEVMSNFSGENIGKLYQMPVEILSARSPSGGTNTSRMFVISS